MSNDTLFFNQAAVGVAAVSLGSIFASLKGGNGIIVRAMSTNTGRIFVGGDNSLTSANGYELLPGELITMDILNPAGDLFLRGEVATDRICVAQVAA